MRVRRNAATLAAAVVVSVLLVAGPAGAVVGGTTDTANRFANVGVLQLHVDSDWSDFCSGTLVRADVVLTAAHLIRKATRPTPRWITSWCIQTG